MILAWVAQSVNIRTIFAKMSTTSKISIYFHYIKEKVGVSEANKYEL